MIEIEISHQTSIEIALNLYSTILNETRFKSQIRAPTVIMTGWSFENGYGPRKME